MDTEKKSIKSLLNELQLNSWNLELVISGLALFLLLGLEGRVNSWSEYAYYLMDRGTSGEIEVIIFMSSLFLKTVWFIACINLVLHLFLRGFWIALIGLRYVSGDIELAPLRFNDRFNKELSKMQHYDDFIEKVEKLCSTIFSLTFLIFFLALSMTAFLIYLLFVDFLFGFIITDERSTFAAILSLSSILPWFIYFIDFITLGGIKRIKKPAFIARIYLPIYRILNVLSLSILYRHILYNLMDNRYGKRLILLLFGYLVTLVFYASTHIDSHYFRISKSAYNQLAEKGEVVPNRYYDDQRQTGYIYDFSVPSMYVENDRVSIFFSYNPRHDVTMKKICPDIAIPDDQSIIFRSNLINKRSLEELDYNEFLDCFKKTISLRVNGEKQDSLNFYYQYKIDPLQPGFVTHLDVSDIPEKEFLLEVSLTYFDERPDTMKTQKIALPLLK